MATLPGNRKAGGAAGYPVVAQGGGSSPTNVQVVLTSLDAASTAFSLPVQPNHQTVAWKSVAGASSYNVYAQDYASNEFNNSISTPYRVIQNVTAALAASGYSSYVSGNTSGGFASVNVVDSAFHDINCPVVVNPTKGTGPVYFQCSGRTYQISAIVGGIEGARSNDSYMVFFAGGQQIMCQGTFNGNLVFSDNTAPIASPLGFTSNALWTPVNNGDLINPFSGIGCYGQLMSLVGLNFMIINMLTNTAGRSFALGPEIKGDQPVLISNLNSTSYGTLSVGQWTQIKIPLNQLYIDQQGGTNALQDAFYKVTLVSNGGANLWLEWYFTVN